ncbi:thiol reductant ABC exporter subunit CydC [Eubacterium sp. MSJ-13]|uniref:thiol reductant ABC exporter subunit CydC n=1 Tax=Eubacterium sp. MSJ-13 TaxID=2841513 RepID=UPI001C0FCE25|nr:thiol reductant ABC exporter subunit CydC [Eubacterium sp. MSJ-13]MBU5478801.1 thiol reductant ABC exporter subunit CydC [Eubacterium sp. MSJ-13]
MSVEKSVKKRRSAVKIMGQLIGLVAPLLHIMLLAIVLGVLGYLCAIFLTILAGQVLLKGLGEPVMLFSDMSIKTLFIIMGTAAVMRGVLHYAEQYCNHFIAFKLLAIIRHKVFAALRRLCPAKLEGRDKGNLISVITTDIELLEVFYAHTISPIMIALLTSAIMVIFMGRYSPAAAVYAAAAYIIVGIFIPLWNGKRGGQTGMEFRTSFGELNSFVLSALRGLSETIQYGMGKEKRHEMQERSEKLGKMQRKLSRLEGTQRAVTNFVILLASFGMLFLMGEMYCQGEIGFDAVITCTVAMMGSFGPVVALASLSNNLNQTLASGERVLSVLEENPVVEEVAEGETADRKNEPIAALRNVTFAYENENILKNFSMEIKKGKITGLHGASGCGKSTILKLLMRFWDADSGEVEISGKNVKEISTKKLRDFESFVTQETDIFHDTIAANIGIAKIGATREEIMAAAKKASLHDFIMSLPDGYDTQVGELGDTLSGGEKQRIGIARAFLHDAPLLLMDEPTSNLDSLNEGVILKAVKEEGKDKNKTVVLVSHRKSTMGVADEVVEL